MSGGGDGLMRVKKEVMEEGEAIVEDFEVLAEVKEELGDDDGCIGEAMRNFLRRREGAATRIFGYGGLMPGVEALPGGRVPELLGFTDQEIAQALPSRALGRFVPYLGEAGIAVGRGRGRVRSRFAGRGRSRCPSQSLTERRRKRKGMAFGSGRPIRLLSNINREARNHSLQIVRHENVRSVAPVNRQGGGISFFSEGHYYRPVSWHKRKYNESSEGFGKTGKYHPEDARLKAAGIFDAIFEDLELYKIPPAWWPKPLTFSDYYTSSSSSDDSGSPSGFDLFCVCTTG